MGLLTILPPFELESFGGSLGRHYESLILHLQREAGRQLLLMVNEKKEQDEVVESLRDMIASLTVSRCMLPYPRWSRLPPSATHP